MDCYVFYRTSLVSHTEIRTSGRSDSPINIRGSLGSERSAPKDEPSSISLLHGIGFVSTKHHSIFPIAALTGRRDFGHGVYQGEPASYCETVSWSLGANKSGDCSGSGS